MIRILVTYVLPILLPTAIYFTWLTALRRAGKAGGKVEVPWIWLLGGGLVLAAIVSGGAAVMGPRTASYDRPPFSYDQPPEPGEGR